MENARTIVTRGKKTAFKETFKSIIDDRDYFIEIQDVNTVAAAAAVEAVFNSLNFYLQT